MEYIDIKKLIDVIRKETKKHANTKERVSKVLDELLDFTKNNYQLAGNYVLQEDLNNYLNSKLNVDGSNIENLEEWKVILNYYDKTETYSQTEINSFLSGKQNTIGYTPENVSNKSDSYTASSSTTYASTKALVDGLATKQKKLSSFDESILIETDGNIEGNVSLFTEYFNQQVCELNFVPTQIIGVYQDGIKLLPEEFNITLPKTITIKTYSTEKIEIQYTHLKNN